MSFYLTPPKGVTSLMSLMKDAETRLLYLCQLHQRWGDNERVYNLLRDHPDLAYNSDCLIEGSDKDCATFYMLKLASLGDEKFQGFLTEAETYFLEHRLSCGGETTIRNTISEVLVHSCYALGNVYLTRSQHEFIPQLLQVLKSVVDAGMDECVDRTQCHHSVKVPWTLVLPLVRSRSVVLGAGQAVVRCQQVVPLLCCLFKTLFGLGFQQLNASQVDKDVQEDERTAPVMKVLYRLYRKHHVGKIMRPLRYLKHEEIHKEAKYFPLCMQELYKALKRHNRLRHHERYRFTLYLKDIGLPLDENIAFWESYYSKPHCSGGGGCQHAWQGSKNRYSYSIRHMYGLEGRRINSASHSCSLLQRLEPHPQERGGCPFNSYKPAELTPLLLPLLGSNTLVQDTIAKEVMAGRPTAACRTLMAFTLHRMQHKATRTGPAASVKQVPGRVSVNQPRASLAPGCGECCDGSSLGGHEAATVSTQREACEALKPLSPEAVTSSSTKHCSRGGTLCDTGCCGVKTASGGTLAGDIEDVAALMPQCLFNRPSQYYLKVVSGEKSPS